jgi:hypothetical protein
MHFDGFGDLGVGGFGEGFDAIGQLCDGSFDLLFWPSS